MSVIAPWRRWSLRTRSLLVVLIPLVVLLLATFVVVKAARATASAEDDVRTGIQVLSDIHALHASLAEAASGVRGYLLTGDKDFLAPYWRAEASLRRRLDRLDQSARDPVLRASLKDIEGKSTQKMGELERMIIGMERTDALNFESMSDNKQLLDQIRQTIQMMEAQERRVIESREQSADRARTWNLWLSVFAVILGIGVAVVIARLFSNDLINRIRSLGRNAKLLAEGRPPIPLPAWSDELGQLGERLEVASQLLSDRADEAQKARDEAERANRAKTEFLSRISHELRTPLNAILGFSRLLHADAPTDLQQRQCRHVMDAGQHLLDLVNEVMDISRIEAGELELRMQPVSLAEALESAHRLVALQADARQVVVTLPVLSDTLQVHADPQRLRQVLINLLSNAIKFGAERAEVRVETATADARVRLSVIDNGSGIHPRDQALLFAPFTRLRNASDVEGTGLGLALSKRLIEAMNGQIGVISHLGRGATFWFELPLAQAAAQTIAPSAGVGAPPEERVSGLRTQKVLYIEDNASNRLLVETLLARRPGYVLRVAENAAEGMRVFDHWQPDCLLLDLHLPDLPGLEVLARVRAERGPKELKVVIVSADVLPETRERAIATGANHFLLKPIDATALYRSLELTP